MVVTEMEKQDELLAEFEYWLKREGITFPAERCLAGLADFVDVRRHVEIVDIACQSAPESSTVLVLRPGMVLS